MRIGHQTGRAKVFTPAQVARIRALHATGDLTFETLGRRFGVKGSTIANVVQRRGAYADPPAALPCYDSSYESVAAGDDDHAPTRVPLRPED